VATNLIKPIGCQETTDSVLIYFHGGGFVFGSPDLYSSWTCQIAQHTGLTTLVPAYRLAPEHKHPTQLIDCLATVIHTQSHFGPKNIILAGDSAGGNLVLTVIFALQNPTLFLEHVKGICDPSELRYIELLLTKQQKPNILGGILMSPWLNLEHTDQVINERIISSKDVMFPNSRHQELVFCVIPNSVNLRNPFVSPMFIPPEDLAKFPPILIHAGQADPLFEDIFQFGSILKQQNCLNGKKPLVNSQLATWPDCPHVFQLLQFPFFRQPTLQSLKGIGTFINQLHGLNPPSSIPH